MESNAEEQKEKNQMRGKVRERYRYRIVKGRLKLGCQEWKCVNRRRER